MTHILRFLILGLILPLHLFALNSFQPLLKNYELPLEYKTTEIKSISALQDQTMLFAVPKGVLVYDGKAWNLLTIPEQPTVLYYDSFSGKVFVGCEKSIGVIEKDIHSRVVFTPLVDSLKNKSAVFSIVSLEEKIFFVQKNEISCYNSIEKKIVKTWQSDKNPYESAFTYKGDIYVSVKGKGVYKFTDTKADKITSTTIGEVAVTHSTGEQLFICSKQGRMFSFTNGKLKVESVKSSKYVAQNGPEQGIVLEDKYCAIGTRNAGVMVLNRKTGKVEQSINYQTSLPDDEISCLFLDDNKGLWIGHGAGISRADMSIPIADFSVYPGLKGAVQTSLIHDNTLYVGTSEGVFYLTSVNSYSDVSSYTRVEKTTETVTTVPMMRKVKKIVRVSFQNKSGKGAVTKDIPVEIEVPVDSIVGLKQNKFSTEKLKEQYVLNSFPLQFKKIANLSSKCLHLCSAKKDILVGTNNGLFVIKNKVAEELMEQVTVKYIEPSINGNYFALSTAGLLSFAYDKNFEIISMNENLIDASSLDFADNTLWVTAKGALKKIRVAKGRYFGIEESYPLTDYFPEDNVVANINGIPTLFTYSNAYTFDFKSSTVQPNGALDKYVSVLQRPVVKQQNFFWVKEAGRWSNLKDSVENSTKGFLMNYFDQIQDIQRDVKGNLWVVSGGKLYKVYGEVPASKKNPLYSVSINKLASQSNFEFTEDIVSLEGKNFGLEIDFSSKFYFSEKKSQYRYRLLGINDEWSEWSELSVIKYPYIPGGNYVFELESKNVVGHVSAMKPIEVHVHTPFWEQWWFYLSFGSVLMGGLVYVFASKTAVAGVQLED